MYFRWAIVEDFIFELKADRTKISTPLADQYANVRFIFRLCFTRPFFLVRIIFFNHHYSIGKARTAHKIIIGYFHVEALSDDTVEIQKGLRRQVLPCLTKTAFGYSPDTENFILRFLEEAIHLAL